MYSRCSFSTSKTMRCTANTQSYTRCKRNCVDESDFCKQHNPLNKLDDITCAICLDDIKNPIKISVCSHVFCKECIANSVLHSNLKCPCCRAQMYTLDIKECIKFRMGKQPAEKFHLHIDMGLWTERWHGGTPWTNAMKKRYFSVYPVPPWLPMSCV